MLDSIAVGDQVCHRHKYYVMTIEAFNPKAQSARCRWTQQGKTLTAEFAWADLRPWTGNN